MDYLLLLIVVGLQITFPICSGSDITTLSDDITDQACNSSLQPAVVTDPGLIQPPKYDNGTYLASQDCRWLLRAPQGSIVSLEFLYIEVVESVRCYFANLTLYDGDSVHSDRTLVLCGHDSPPVIRSSHINILVVFQSGRVVEGRGFEAMFDIHDIQESGCVWRDFDSMGWENGGFYSPNWPLPYPTGQLCEWRVTAMQLIRLEFLDFDLEEGDSRGNCGSDQVTVYDISTTGAHTKLGVYCGNHPPYSLGSTGSGLLVRFESGDHNEGHTGFRLRFHVTNSTEHACGGSGPAELDWAPGLVISPPTDISLCLWRLTAPITRVIHLSVHTFDLPSCTQCGCAGLDIYSGPTHNSPLIGRFCGTGWEGHIAIGSNQVFLEYDSYNLNGHSGFEVLYEYKDISEEACNDGKPVELTHDDGLVTSPNYDQGNYPNNANCQWLIKTSFGYGVTLEFRLLEIEQCDRCKCDYLRVHNGDTPSAPHTHIGTYCGQYSPNPVTSTVSAIFLTFVSDQTAAYKGFNIAYRFTYFAEKACGPAQPLGMSNEPGEILSEGYELGENYKQDSDCYWRITADSDQTVELHLRDFEVEGGDRCEFDYFIIYDGIDESESVIARLCDDVKPTVFHSSGQRMFLHFHSNHVIEKKGFHFQYNFRESSGGSGIGFLPAVLVCIVILGVLAMIGAYCRINSRFKKFKAWLCRITGRNRNEDAEMQPATTSSGSERREDSVQNDTDFVPTPVGSVVCPPSDIDNMHYFAIADFAPPTYEEATAGTNQNRETDSTNTGPAHESGTDSVNTELTRATNSTATHTNQNRVSESAGIASVQSGCERSSPLRGGTETRATDTSGTVNTGCTRSINTSDRMRQSTTGSEASHRASVLQSNTGDTGNSDSDRRNIRITGQNATHNTGLQRQPRQTNSRNRVHTTPAYPGSSRMNSGASQSTSQNRRTSQGATSSEHVGTSSQRPGHPRDIRTNTSALGNPDMGLSLLRQTGLYGTERLETCDTTSQNTDRTQSGSQCSSTPQSTQYPSNKSTLHSGIPKSMHSNMQRSKSVDGMLNDTSPSFHGNTSQQRSASTEQLGPSTEMNGIHNPVYSALLQQGTANRSRSCDLQVKDKQKSQCAEGAVEVSSQNEEKTRSEVGETQRGKDNCGYVDDISNQNVQTCIVLHRLESWDRDVVM